MPRPVITLTTDFGLKDGYVAAMRGVILRINPDAEIVDVTHDISPQDIASAAFVLGAAYSYFPEHSIHVAVVDPDVGTSRRALVLRTPKGVFVAPDNGLLTYVLKDYRAKTEGQAGFMEPCSVTAPSGCDAFSLTNSSYWLSQVSSTFHGRDIFAPVAAHLSLGEQPEKMGVAVAELTCLNIPDPKVKDKLMVGKVIHVDRFGNLITNIENKALLGKKAVVEIKNKTIVGIAHTYASKRGLAAILGSHGYLEIAVANGSAAEVLKARVGEEVRVTFRP